MITTEEWLPIGSVVHLEDTDALVFIAGSMQQDMEDGHLWDYFGYAYPLGNVGDDSGIAFDKDSIDGVCFLGLQDADGMRYQDILNATNDEYEKAKEEARRAVDTACAQGSHPDGTSIQDGSGE